MPIFVLCIMEMVSTDKESCQILVRLLYEHGVRHVVVSPGSRNAPIVVALAANKDIKKTVVVDERSAGFIALGIASITNMPVAVVCTSGTAVLNYAPSVAEAYYRKMPIIVISADRPIEWIDQDDSQTLRQYEALSHYVKKSYNIPSRCNDDTSRWYVNRIVNDALLTVNSHRKAPVHINIQLDEPLGNKISQIDTPIRVINRVSSNTQLSSVQLAELSSRIANASKVLIVAGFYAPNEQLNQSLIRIADNPNVVVMCESISNLHSSKFICTIDRTLSILGDDAKQQLSPNIVITFGGAIVSRFVKQYLRRQPHIEHWHVGITDTTIDCFQSLSLRIDIEPEDFFPQLAAQSIGCTSDYSAEWHNVAKEAELSHWEYIRQIGWSDLKAFSILMDRIPSTWNLQLSNGTSIRYAQLFSSESVGRSDCNRGVSGIDGCTSTAIGASMGYNDVTLLITGDMSAQYDIGALACSSIPNRFKMIVLCNGGGGIFRFINSTSQLLELDEYFAVASDIPLRQLADGYNMSFYEANNVNELFEVLPSFMQDSERPSILAINTPPLYSAEVLIKYFTRHIKN